MPYFKRDGEELLTANWVRGPYDAFDLTGENHTEHEYPVDGWYWFDNLDAALAGLPRTAAQVVSMRQARLALLGAGLMAQVNAAIAAMPGVEGEAARIEWEFANEIARNSSLVSGLSSALGLTDAQLDQLFNTAAAL